MELESITVDALLECNEYHRLAPHQLDRLDDAEALYQHANRNLHGIGIKQNSKLGWHNMKEAARRGHPVALGACFLRGQGTEENEAQAFELFRASADCGMHQVLAFESQSRFSQFSQLNPIG
jgi:TPR repeat protein